MRALSEAEKARAAELHRDAVVVDTLSQFGPSSYPPEVLGRLDEMVARGDSASNVLVALWDATFEAVADNGLPDFWAEWDETGVDAVSVTIGAFGAKPFTYENAIHDLGLFGRLFDTQPDRLVKVTSSHDIAAARRDGKKAVIMNFQNTTHIGDDISQLDLFSSDPRTRSAGPRRSTWSSQ